MKLTGEPIRGGYIGFHIVVCSPPNLKKKPGSIRDVAVDIQSLALMSQSMHTEGLVEAICCLSGISKLSMEYSNSFLEICYSFV